MSVALTIILALVVPIGWGVLSAWFFDLVRARRGAGQCDDSQDNS